MPQMPARSRAWPVSRSARERTCRTTAMMEGAGIVVTSLSIVPEKQMQRREAACYSRLEQEAGGWICGGSGGWRPLSPIVAETARALK